MSAIARQETIGGAPKLARNCLGDSPRYRVCRLPINLLRNKADVKRKQYPLILVVWGNEAGTDRKPHQAGNVVYVEAIHQVRAMCFDRLDTDAQSFGNIAR